MFTTPAEPPVTVPVDPTVAIVVFPLIQLPPVGVPVKVIEDPLQTSEEPDIDAAVLTVTE
jgi:hypothetical protein